MNSALDIKWEGNQTCLITGGTGLIGSYLIRELLDLGKKVVVMSGSTDASYIADTVDRITFVPGSTKDLSTLIHVVKDHNVDIVFHMDYSGNRPTNKAVGEAIQLNMAGFHNVLEAARLFDVDRVVFGSSQSVYGLAEFYDGKVDETVAPRPVLVYGAWRLFNEHMARFYRDEHGVSSVGLRFSVVYGLGKSRLGDYSIAHLLIENAIMGRPVEMPPVNYSVCWEYIRDAVQACLRGAAAPHPEHVVYNVGGFVSTCEETVDILRQFIPDLSIIQQDEYILPHPIEVSDVDMTRAKEELGYEPVYTLEKGIKDYMDMYAKMADQYKSAWTAYRVLPLP